MCSTHPVPGELPLVPFGDFTITLLTQSGSTSHGVSDSVCASTVHECTILAHFGHDLCSVNVAFGLASLLRRCWTSGHCLEFYSRDVLVRLVLAVVTNFVFSLGSRKKHL